MRIRATVFISLAAILALAFALGVEGRQTSDYEIRTWTDATGKYTIDAEFRGLAFSEVKLRKANGKEITVPLEKLSAQDQQWIRERRYRRRRAVSATDTDTDTDTSEYKEWERSYTPGYTDSNGNYMGGSEIHHLVGHQGKLYAGNSFWMDPRNAVYGNHKLWDQAWAQVLRLDSPDGKWQSDLELGQSHMKVYVLETITLTQDASGQPLSQPLDLLVLAASAPNKSVCRKCFTFGVHNDVSGGWHTEIVTVSSGVPHSGGDDGWQTRSLAVHIDKVTGLEHVFVSLGKPGILKGTYNPSKPTKITWESQVEYPGGSSLLDMRPMALTVANGSLYFSADDEIYKRRDGASPSYSIVHALGLDGTATNGGIRGMTTIPNPNGTGESLIYMWSGLDWPPNGDVMRLDIDEQANPPTYTQHTEVNVLDLMDQLVAPGGDITFTMGPHSEFRPVTDPGTGETVHVFGLLAALRAGSDPSLFWKNHDTQYGGAMYGIRSADGQEYKINQVNGLYDNTDPSKPVLVAPRSFAVSPFGDKMLYAGGHDCAWVNTEADMAWIFRAGLRTALGR